MTDPVGKTNSSRKKRVSTTKKAVAPTKTSGATGSSTKQSTVSGSIKKIIPSKSAFNTVEDLNSSNYPLHPERIWPD